jgi:hypothetical protein
VPTWPWNAPAPGPIAPGRPAISSIAAVTTWNR